MVLSDCPILAHVIIGEIVTKNHCLYVYAILTYIYIINLLFNFRFKVLYHLFMFEYISQVIKKNYAKFYQLKIKKVCTRENGAIVKNT